MGTNKRANGADVERLLQLHRLHLGLYTRIAKELSVNPNFVSRVAQGKRKSEKVRSQLLKELRKLT
jgi:hypothetical protein